MPRDAAAFGAAFGVSRETCDRLSLYVELLRRWQSVTNLVSRHTLDEVWHRHVADSAQLVALAPDARSWADLGSGAGFPGMVVALLIDGRGGRVTLVESNAKKCAFLREVARETGAPAEVRHGRIEEIAPLLGPHDVVTARALAPLDALCALALPLLAKGAVGLFPKGRDAEDELTAAQRSWRISYDLLPSRTDAAARIVRITRAEALT